MGRVRLPRSPFKEVNSHSIRMDAKSLPRMPPKVPGEGKLEEAVFALRTLADVVDDPRSFAAVRGWDDEGDVG
jgi:hypothetical protein